MRGANSGVVDAIPRQASELVLGGHPAVHLPGSCGQDTERLPVQAAECFRLVKDGRQLQELDPGGFLLVWRGVECPCGVASLRRQTAEPASQREFPETSACGCWKECRNALPHRVEAPIFGNLELIRRCRVD